MDINIVLAFAGAMLAVTIKPGPGILAAISRSLSDGWKQGAAIGLGHATMHVAYFTVVCLTYALAKELDILEFLSILMKSLGAAYMIHLGIKELNRLNVALAVPNAQPSGKDLLRNYMTGLMIGVSNPILILFYAGLVPTFVPVEQLQAWWISILCLIIAVINGGGQVVACYGADRVRVFFDDQSNTRGIHILVGVMFILIGLVMGISALPLIDWNTLYFGNKV